MASAKGPILVVDDEADIVDFLTTVLQEEGYQTETARDGLEALDKIRDRHPSLVILDLMMPRMNGLQVLESLRMQRHERSRSSPPILVLSAKSTHQDILAALEGGADDFVPKPFDLEDLLLRVRVWLDRVKPIDSRPSTLRIYTLSPFRILLGEELIMDEEVGDQRARLLLKYLVTASQQPIQRSDPIYMLWPDLEAEKGDRNLGELLNNIRALTGDAGQVQTFVREQGSLLMLDFDADVWLDATEFESQVGMAQDAQKAGDIDIALGLFLSGLALYKEDYLRENLFDDWPSERREKLRESWISSMFRVAAICAERCEFSDSVRFMKKILDIDPYRENAYQALMLYLSRGGRRGEAIQLYRYAERLFAQHLSAQPAPMTRTLYERILRGEAN